MAECPICNRTFDARFAVYVLPDRQPYDTVECARKAARAAGDGADVVPVLLPAIESLPPRVAPVARSRVKPAVPPTARVLAPAVAAGLSLVAVGAASSVYLWAGLPHPRSSAVVAAPDVPTGVASRSTGSGSAPVAGETGGSETNAVSGSDELARGKGPETESVRSTIEYLIAPAAPQTKGPSTGGSPDVLEPPAAPPPAPSPQPQPPGPPGRPPAPGTPAPPQPAPQPQPGPEPPAPPPQPPAPQPQPPAPQPQPPNPVPPPNPPPPDSVTPPDDGNAHGKPKKPKKPKRPKPLAPPVPAPPPHPPPVPKPVPAPPPGAGPDPGNPVGNPNANPNADDEGHGDGQGKDNGPNGNGNGNGEGNGNGNGEGNGNGNGEGNGNGKGNGNGRKP